MPVVPSDKEEEYFARLEMEKRRKAEEEAKKAMAEAERKRLKELHHMRCPKCGMPLSEIEYKGVKVDKCFSCEGVWLDGGELEQISKMEKGVSEKFFGLFGGKG